MTAAESEILNTLNKRGYTRRSGNWYGTKCPFCGDSKRDKSVHLYVRLAGDNNISMKCYRINCDVHRNMSIADALQLGITEKGVLELLANKRKEKTERVITIKNNIRLSDDLSNKCIYDYFKKRTDISLANCNDLERYSIVSNLEDFIGINKLPEKVVFRLKNIVKSTENKVVGFLNRDRTLLYLRRCDDTSDNNHFKINITSEIDIIHSPYEVISNVNELDKDIYISYAEGCFDAVNMSKHMLNNVPNISLASYGYSHLFSAMRMYSRHYRDVNTLVVKDKDVDKVFIERYLKFNKYRFNGKVYIVDDEINHDLGDYSKVLKPRLEEILL